MTKSAFSKVVDNHRIPALTIRGDDFIINHLGKIHPNGENIDEIETEAPMMFTFSTHIDDSG